MMTVSNCGRTVPMRVATLVLAGLVHGTATFGQTPTPQTATPSSDENLALQLSNPVASLVSVPLQFNWDHPVGVDRDTRLTLNFQPVIPFSVSDDWNLVVRWVMPYVAQPRLTEASLPTSGLSDVVASFFLSPARPGRFIWAAGPVLLLPLTSDPTLGAAKWGAGPTFVILKQTKGWTYGALVNHLWSFAGDDFSGGVPRAPVNASFVQPFVSYTTPGAVTFGANLEASANWKADERWTVPVHLTMSKLTQFASIPMSVGGGIGIYTAAPGGSPDWRLRFSATLLLPRR